LTRNQIAAQTTLNNALNRQAVATGFSVTTSQDSGFAASRNRERTRQLFQGQDRSRQQEQKKEKDDTKKQTDKQIDLQQQQVDTTLQVLEAIQEAGFSLRIR